MVTPFFAFEMVRSPADVEALFHEQCRAVPHAQAQYQGLWLDILLFIGIYSAFLICGLLALKQDIGLRSKRLVTAGIGLVLVAALSDQFENYILLRILDRFPGDQSTIDTLYFAPRLKFIALGIATAFAGLLRSQSGVAEICWYRCDCRRLLVCNWHVRQS